MLYTALLYILILVVYYIDTRNLQHTPSYQVDIPFTAKNICIPSYHWHCINSDSRGVFYCPSELPLCIIYFHRIYHSEIVYATRNDKGYLYIRVLTKLPNSEQSYKGKVKTHKYIYRQNQSTTENYENRNDPDLVQAFLKKWWVESDFKAPNLRFHYGSKTSAVTIAVFITILEQNS